MRAAPEERREDWGSDSADAIQAEWLYEKRPGEREFELFLRSGDEYKVSKTRFAEGLGKQSATPANRLFVSLVGQLNGKVSQSILDWFSNIDYMSGMDNDGYAGKTLEMLFLNQRGAGEIFVSFPFLHGMRTCPIVE